MMRALAIAWLLVGCGSLSAATAPPPPADTGSAGTGTGTGGPGGCAPVEEPADLGQRCATAEDRLGPVDDGGGPVRTITGNLHTAGDEDWYLVDAVDLGGDAERGYEDFRLEIRLTEGVGAVVFQVFQGDCGQAVGCETEEGYDAFRFFAHDISPDEGGFIPQDPRACSAPGGPLNDCPDWSGPFYVRVWAPDGGVVCDPYTLEVSNGIWDGTTP